MFKKILAFIGLLSVVSFSPVLANTTAPAVHGDLTAGYEYLSGYGAAYPNNGASVFTETFGLSADLTKKFKLFGSVGENQIARQGAAPVLAQFKKSIATWDAGLGVKLTPSISWQISGGTELNNNLILPTIQPVTLTKVSTSLKLRVF